MCPLSTTYNCEDLIWSAIEKQKKCANDDMKILVLSCRQLSNTFDDVMQNITLEYGKDYSLFYAEKGKNVGIYRIGNQGHWMAPFVRKLCISSKPDNAELSFLKKVFLFGNLEKLSLYHLEYAFFAYEEIKNLISITRILKINCLHIARIQSFLPRCKTIYFVNDFYNQNKFKQFAKNLNSDSSVTLEFNCGQFSLHEYIRVLSLYDAKLQHMTRFYFTFYATGFVSDTVLLSEVETSETVYIRNLINRLKTDYPNVENISIALQRDFKEQHLTLQQTFQRFEHLKQDFDSTVVALRNMPPNIKATVFYVVNSNFCDRNNLHQNFFTSNDFKFTTNNKLPTITNHQPKLQENAEFFYQLDLKY